MSQKSNGARFEEVARLSGIGEKFGEPFDVVYMQKNI